MKRLILCLPGMILTLFASLTAFAGAPAPGESVYFGYYRGEPVKWVCVERGQSETLIMTERIIDLKAFDAKGLQENDVYGYRAKSGGNRWKTSSLRAWLNSEDSETLYPSGHRPDGAHLKFGLFPQSSDAGFLSQNNFTGEQLELIAKKSVATCVSDTDVENGVPHNYGSALYDFYQNYDQADKEYTEDKVFLPCVDDLRKLIEGEKTGVFGKSFYQALPAAGLWQRYQGVFAGLEQNDYWYYWLRDSLAYADNNSLVRCVYPRCAVKSHEAYNDAVGIRPMMALKNESFSVVGGVVRPAGAPADKAERRVLDKDGETVLAILNLTKSPQSLRAFFARRSKDGLIYIRSAQADITDFAHIPITREECEQNTEIFLWDQKTLAPFCAPLSVGS